MPELEKQKDGKYKWNPVIGRDYYLGYHHGIVAGIGMADQEEVRAFYFGTQNGDFIFFREKEGRVLKYQSDINALAVWFGGAGDDEPSFSGFQAIFSEEITNEIQKLAILNKLNVFKRNNLEKKVVE